ncbi:hypothetical protein [Actinomadura madurae]|nr:hypothetical protein [Actinomadura madurae]
MISAPPATAGRTPVRAVRRPITIAAAVAVNAPGVEARPALRIE